MPERHREIRYQVLGNADDSTAAPHPPKTNQDVPMSSAVNRLARGTAGMLGFLLRVQNDQSPHGGIATTSANLCVGQKRWPPIGSTAAAASWRIGQSDPADGSVATQV